MFVTADSLMPTQYILYSTQFIAQTICAVQQTVLCPHNMCGTAGSLMLTQYVRYSRQFNTHTICAVKQTV